VICAEYDALPGIGHACGHNIIAACAVGAGLALAEVADEIGVTVRVMGTPAEEGGGGKIVLIDAGAFAGAHLSLMAHPGPLDVVEPHMIAAQQFRARYTGKEAHASAFPELGINAADAVTVAQVAIGLLRQHVEAGQQVHGIVTDGGDAPNIVPAHCEVEYIIRGKTLPQFTAMREKVLRCFEAGALATGTTVDIHPRHEPYNEVCHDPVLADFYRRNAEARGRVFPVRERRPGGSTDMGNVSYLVPSIHPMIGIGSLPAVNHQPEFTAHCVMPDADRALADAAVAMAWTVIDAATDQEARARLLKT
jgi:amidohydrolase